MTYASFLSGSLCTHEMRKVKGHSILSVKLLMDQLVISVSPRINSNCDFVVSLSDCIFMITDNCPCWLVAMGSWEEEYRWSALQMTGELLL